MTTSENNTLPIKPEKLSATFTTKLATLALVLPLTLYSTSSLATTANTEVYDEHYFSQYAAQTLYELLQNIPGANGILLAVEAPAQNRGFGSFGDQILIDKQRLSGKQNSIDKELKSIQADRVARIEVIKGNSSELDVQTQGVVINVVLKSEQSSSVLWTAGAVKVADMSANSTGSVTYQTKHKNTDYRIGLAHQVTPVAIEREENHLSQQQDITYTNVFSHREKTKTTRLTGMLNRAFNDELQLRINGFFEKYKSDEIVNNDINQVPSVRQTFYDWDRDKWELGGDISYRATAQDNIKFLFISNKTDAYDGLWQISNPNTPDAKLSYQLPREYQTREQILRASWKHQLSPTQVFESGLEQAINRRNERLALTSTDFQSVEKNDIKETRYEYFVTYNHEFTPQLKLQSSLAYETSTMDVATNFSLPAQANSRVSSFTSRDFSYLKPWVSVSYDFDEGYQTRFTYQRTVSQLSLRQFVPWYNQFESRLEAANPDLKPEVKDKFSVTFERQWQQTSGSLSLTPFYYDISDLITEIVLAQGSGDGNVDKAKEYGVTLDTNFGLELWQLPNTRISASYTWTDSEMINPFTGEKAPMERRSEHSWNLQLNQNEILPGLSFALALQKKSPYQFRYYSYDGRLTSELKANAYIDYKISSDLKLRIAGENLLKDKYRVYKSRHRGHYGTTEFVRLERRDNQFQPVISATLSGNF